MKRMSKETTMNLFLELADSFSDICYHVDWDECITGKCPFSKKNKYGNDDTAEFVCVFKEKGMGFPGGWKRESDEE